MLRRSALPPARRSRAPEAAWGHPQTTLARRLQFTFCVTTLQEDPIVGTVIGAAIEVHRELGPGLLESTYKGCLAFELIDRQITFATEVALPVIYKNTPINCGYRLDFLVEGQVIVEVKSVEALLPIHTAQVLTYLRLTGAKRALLLNFNALTLKDGLRSYVGHGNAVPRGRS